jgi:hypothetical protein
VSQRFQGSSIKRSMLEIGRTWTCVMFLLYYYIGFNIHERCFHECYANDSRTTICGGVLGHSVLVQPQLKPSHGICCSTTMTFGTHHGADRCAGWSLHSDGISDSFIRRAHGLWPRLEDWHAHLRHRQCRLFSAADPSPGMAGSFPSVATRCTWRLRELAGTRSRSW